jgi:hypothetical protein
MRRVWQARGEPLIVQNSESPQVRGIGPLDSIVSIFSLGMSVYMLTMSVNDLVYPLGVFDLD